MDTIMDMKLAQGPFYEVLWGCPYLHGFSLFITVIPPQLNNV